MKSLVSVTTLVVLSCLAANAEPVPEPEPGHIVGFGGHGFRGGFGRGFGGGFHRGFGGFGGGYGYRGKRNPIAEPEALANPEPEADPGHFGVGFGRFGGGHFGGGFGGFRGGFGEGYGYRGKRIAEAEP
ncbi:hypothetical protein SK128_010510 [Halocaridina rubra]|uniref:Uncharacterized protein n=1 Tax=Halocaridina rubra TaxID=373956 RepID=A0AAN8X1R6_HALRR